MTRAGGGEPRPTRRPPRVGMLSVHTSPLDQPGTGDGGGLNVYVLQTARRLAARGVEVEVFTRLVDGDAPRAEELADGLVLHRVEAGRPGPMPKTDLANQLCSFVAAMERQAGAGRFDVLHAHYWLSGWVARRLRAPWRVPVVVTFHTLGTLKNRTLAPGDVPEPALRLVAEGRIAGDADRVAVLTEEEARLVRDTLGVPGQRVAVVPAGVDLDAFGPDGAAATVPGGGPLLLFVGRLQPLKGPDVAVRTLAAVREVVPDVRLAVVGGASGTAGTGRTDPASLRQLAGALGVADALHLHDPVPQAELARWYRAADVLLAPSRSETFGLVPLEAQACGTPVVAADVPGLRASVGRGGLLVEGHDPADHAGAAVRVLRDPALAGRLRAGALAAAAATTWDATTEALLRVYGQAMVDAAPMAVAG